MIKRKAFTLVELIFVIIVLGISSSIVANIIADVFESYIIQRALHKASIKTELAIEQLGNRLTSRINKSIIAKKPNTNTFVALRNYVEAVDENKTALEWIGYDNDGFSASIFPNPSADSFMNWSGFCDLNISSFGTIATPGSKLSKADVLLSNISGNGLVGSGLLFMGQPFYQDNGITKIEYQPSCMGYTNSACIGIIGGFTDTSITLSNPGTAGEMVYSEFYQIVNSAYTVVPEQNADGSWDLNMYSNYQPWNGEKYQIHGTRSTLIENVTVFRFYQRGSSIRLKICAKENVGGDYDVSICKEKAVIR